MPEGGMPKGMNPGGGQQYLNGEYPSNGP